MTNVTNRNPQKVLREDDLYNIPRDSKEVNTFVPVLFTRTSPFSQKTNNMKMTIRPKDYIDWKEGAMIQNAFTYLNADQREFLMTGITADEWPGDPDGDPSEAADHDDGPRAA